MKDIIMARNRVLLAIIFGLALLVIGGCTSSPLAPEVSVPWLQTTINMPCISTVYATDSVTMCLHGRQVASVVVNRTYTVAARELAGQLVTRQLACVDKGDS